MNRDGANESIWQSSHNNNGKNNEFDADLVYDVIVVGAGMTGISTALELQRAGKKVVICEAHNICFGTSGGTTAHLNNFFDSSYDEVIKNFGEDNAKLLATGAKDAINHIRENVDSLAIDCSLETRTGFIFSIEEKQNKILEDLVEGTKKAGVSIDFINDSPFPIPYLKIASIDKQAQFNPVSYLYALAEAFKKIGGIILENCLVKDIKEDEIITADTAAGDIKGKSLVYATHIPPGVNILHFRCAPYRSYALGLKLKSGSYPQAMGYDLCDPYHYYRTQEIEGEKYLIAGGEDHKTGHEENTENCFRKLESYCRNYFDISEVSFKWSSQYFESADGLPYIGHLPGNGKNIFTATGFSGNGMIYGTLSALILTDLIMKKENKFSSLFSPARVKPVAGFSSFVKEAADVVKRFIGDKLSVEKIYSLAELAAGEAKVVKYEHHVIAIYKDEGNEIHAVNASCPHIKCNVAWNSTEKSWDCPCHGSRFSVDGNLLTAPARAPLEKIDMTDLKEK